METIPGVGPACRAEGGWHLLLPDGSTVFTHGPDPAPPEGFDSTLPDPHPQMVIVPPACASPGKDSYYGVIVYARAYDTPDRYERMEGQIRVLAARANTLLLRESLASGVPMRFRFLCEGVEVVVKNVVLPTPSSRANPGTIFYDLSQSGLNLPTEKYIVWYDGSACWCAGIATIAYDDRPLVTNVNNRGPSWGLTFGYTGSFGWYVMMHEYGHNLGAVQISSPNSSGGWHCNDGADVMCYPDGGYKANYKDDVCARLDGGYPRWDCNGDDYFNPLPLPGNYLYNHWNVGSRVNRFLTYAT